MNVESIYQSSREIYHNLLHGELITYRFGWAAFILLEQKKGPFINVIDLTVSNI